MILTIIVGITLAIFGFLSWINFSTALFSLTEEKKWPKYTPMVSVIVRSWNDGLVVERCIENFLKQNYPKDKYEIIILDDGSTDDTEEVCKKYVKEKKIVYVKFKKHSELKAKVVDFAIEKVAKGEIILETDVDFVLPKDWISEMVKPFADPQVGGVTGRAMCGNWYRNFLTKIRALEDFWHFCISMFGRYQMTESGFLYGSSKAYRKKVWKKVGGHPTKTLVEDAELAVKILEHGYKIVNIKVANLAEEVENLPQFFDERKRWVGGDLDVAKHYGKELARNKLYYMLMTANFGLDGILLLSWLLVFFNRLFLVPIVLNIFALWIGLYGVKAKNQFYFWTIPYTIIGPILQAIVIGAIAKEKISGKKIRWTKVWHHPTKLFWPLRD